MTSIPHYHKKIRPNEPCPCGSNKKYKKCHGHFKFDQSLNPYSLDDQLRSLKPSSKCLVPDSFAHECTKGTINAHTISRSGSLGAIERKGHVYSYKLSLQGLINSSGKIFPTLTGWRQASTFPGFCGFHDKKLFEPLEDQAFIGTKEQCFLLAYRCAAREMYAKKTSSLQIPLRQVLGAESLATSQFIADFNLGVELGLNDSMVHKKRYDALLETKNWNAVRTLLIEFDSIFPIQCAGGFFPEKDIFGKKIQDLGIGKSTPSAMNIISFAANEKSYILFCWLADSDKCCADFVSSLLKVPELNLPSVLASLILQVSENCHFSPDWYDSVHDEGVEWCSEQIRAGMPFHIVPPPAENKGISYFSNVTIRSITTNA